MAMILIVDDEPGIRAFMADALTDAGYAVAEAADGAAAVARLEEHEFDLMFLDLKMPGPRDGMDVLRRARALWPRLPVIVLTAHGSVGTAVEAMHMGAADFLEKPLDGPGELRRLAARAMSQYVGTSAAHEPGSTRWMSESTAGMPANPGRSARFHRFLRELRRRHVYKVAVGYLAAGFVGLEVAQLLLPVLPLPEWSYLLMVALAVLGFPAALVLGWVFDVTVTRTPATTPQSG
jgi:DNA-binding NtrC family response regulator